MYTDIGIALILICLKQKTNFKTSLSENLEKVNHVEIGIHLRKTVTSFTVWVKKRPRANLTIFTELGDSRLCLLSLFGFCSCFSPIYDCSSTVCWDSWISCSNTRLMHHYCCLLFLFILLLTFQELYARASLPIHQLNWRTVNQAKTNLSSWYVKKI